MKDERGVNHPPDDGDHRDPALAALYDGAAREMPPPGLDRQVLAAAHRAVGARPHDAGARSAARRWSVPLSVAATLLLSVSLVTTMLRERPEPLPLPETRSPPQQRGYTAQPPPTDDSPGARKAPPAAMAAPDKREREQAAERSAAPAQRPVAPAAPEADAAAAAKSSAARDPDRWLQEIEAQFRRHDGDAARRSLQAFRQRYPDHPVPGALLDMEKTRN